MQNILLFVGINVLGCHELLELLLGDRVEPVLEEGLPDRLRPLQIQRLH